TGVPGDGLEPDNDRAGGAGRGVELPDDRPEGAAGRGVDVEVAQHAAAVDVDVEDPLPDPGGDVFREMQAHAVGPARRQLRHRVGEVAHAKRLVDGLRRGVGDAGRRDRLRGAAGAAALVVDVGQVTAGRGAARVHGDAGGV